jgi:Cu-processing system permease protein
MTWRVVITLAGHELRASLRNRWFILYATAFAVLAAALSAFSLSGAGMFGFAGFGRTAASLINLTLLIVPLMGITVGAAGLAGERERGTLAYLLAQPVARFEVLLGKFVGLAAALLAALLLGFGVSALLIARQGGGVDASRYLALVGFALLLALVSLSLGLLISAWSRTAPLATGVSLFVWLALVFFGDLGLMGGAIAMKLDIGVLFGLALANPLQVFKMATVYALQASLEVLGPAGLFAIRTYGASLTALLIGVLAVWIVAPLAGAYVGLRRVGDV